MNNITFKLQTDLECVLNSKKGLVDIPKWNKNNKILFYRKNLLTSSLITSHFILGNWA